MLFLSPRIGEIILKLEKVMEPLNFLGFSPRNGEIILKERVDAYAKDFRAFQSPQWGNNSKE